MLFWHEQSIWNLTDIDTRVFTGLPRTGAIRTRPEGVLGPSPKLHTKPFLSSIKSGSKVYLPLAPLQRNKFWGGIVRGLPVMRDKSYV